MQIKKYSTAQSVLLYIMLSLFNTIETAFASAHRHAGGSQYQPNNDVKLTAMANLARSNRSAAPPPWCQTPAPLQL